MSRNKANTVRGRMPQFIAIATCLTTGLRAQCKYCTLCTLCMLRVLCVSQASAAPAARGAGVCSTSCAFGQELLHVLHMLRVVRV